MESLEKYVNDYFFNRKSFLTTEVMRLYLAAEDPGIQIQCLELLAKIGE